MGVLPCDREGCGNVMCDYCSSTYGYLCEECFEELVRLGVRENIYVFMRTAKSWNGEFTEDQTRKYFESIFPKRT